VGDLDVIDKPIVRASPAARPAAQGAGIDPGAAWRDAADRLALWAERIVNRRDAWGGYRPPDEWGRRYTRADGSTGELGTTTTRKGRLTRAVLARHFRARDRVDLVGLHSTAADNTSRWGAVDIDHHGPTSTPAAVNLAAALAWYAELAGRGFRPLLTDSNGRGGYHLLVLLSEPIPTPRLFYFLRRLVSDHTRYGMAAAPETFPKQPLLRPRPDGSPGFGSWLRLPGRHHSREHWSRVWDGGRWLDGAAAVAHVLSLTGDPPDLVPDLVPPPPRARRRPAAVPGGDNLSVRIAAYAARLPNLGEGQGRDDVAYHFAAFLARDLALADDVALDWLDRWDGGNTPPKGRAALAEILGNAKLYGRRPIGCGRPPGPPRRDRHGHVILTSRTEVR
jgi:hypothetical protein